MRWSAALLMFAIPACARTLTDARPKYDPGFLTAHIPMQPSDDGEHPHRTLRVSVGPAKLRLVVDTGASLPILSRNKLDRAGVHLDVAEEIPLLDTPGVTLGMVNAVHMIIENVAAWDLPALLSDADGGEADGVIPPQLLSTDELAVRLDFANNDISWVPARRGRSVMTYASGTLRFCHVQQGHVRTWVYLVPTTFNGISAWPILDTGADFTSVSRRHPAAASLSEAQVGRIRRWEGEVWEGKRGRAVVETGPLRAQLETYALQDLACSDGLLGLDMFGKSVIELTPNSVWIEPPASKGR